MNTIQHLHYIITHDGSCSGGGCMKCPLKYVPCTMLISYRDIFSARVEEVKKYLAEYSPEELMESIL